MDAFSTIVAADAGPAAPKLKVFISYSRDDLDFADQLDAALDLCNFEAMLDRHGISGGEEWKHRLGNLIRDADTVVFVLSPASAQSEICRWEVEEALRLGKRILPILCRPLAGTNPPPQLQERNYVYFYREPHAPGSGFGTGLAQLVTALNTDLAWIREHTRLLARATEWDMGGRPINRLLSGSDVADAKDWVARRPKDAPAPTNLHLDFIKSSEEQETARSSAQRQQLEMMARAQEERAKALATAEEALARAADAQAKRAKLRNGALVVVTLFAVFAGWQWTRADAQRKLAEEQKVFADQQKTIAEDQTSQAETQRKIAEQQKHFAEALKGKAVDTLGASISLIVQMSKKYKFDSEDYGNARSVFEKGVELEDSTSMSNLALMYRNGWGTERDFAKSRELYQKAADAGDVESMNTLGALYYNGQGGPTDYGKARELYEMSVARGNASAMFNLGWLYVDGRAAAKDYAKARQLFEKAADSGNTSALVALSALYVNGNGVPQDYAKARELYEKATSLDNTDALNGMAALHAGGLGVPQDWSKAHALYETSAGKGNAVAMYTLAGLYAEGKGVGQDYAKARAWYEKAADNRHPSAMNELGVLYQEGQGGPQDYVKAREWYEKGAEYGNAVAMNNLGGIYYDGKGVAQDFAKARTWYEKAAAVDNARAMNSLGWMYSRGNGVAQDFIKARGWYERSAALGNATAKERLRKLAVEEAEAGKHYDEALKLRIALATEVEQEETKRAGAPGKDTADELLNVAWCALLARDFGMALTVSERAHKLSPNDLMIETNRAHALMFLGRTQEARALYVGYKGKPTSNGGKPWELVIAADFVELRKTQITHPLMDEIEKRLGAR